MLILTYFNNHCSPSLPPTPLTSPSYHLFPSPRLPHFIASTSPFHLFLIFLILPRSLCLHIFPPHIPNISSSHFLLTPPCLPFIVLPLPQHQIYTSSSLILFHVLILSYSCLHIPLASLPLPLLFLLFVLISSSPHYLHIPSTSIPTPPSLPPRLRSHFLVLTASPSAHPVPKTTRARDKQAIFK